jgi:hypothetical protein
VWHLFKVGFSPQQWEAVARDPAAQLGDIGAGIAGIGGQMEALWPALGGGAALIFVEGPAQLGGRATDVAGLFGGYPESVDPKRGHSYVQIGSAGAALSANTYEDIRNAQPIENIYTCGQCGRQIATCRDHAQKCLWRTLCP